MLLSIGSEHIFILTSISNMYLSPWSNGFYAANKSRINIFCIFCIQHLLDHVFVLANIVVIIFMSSIYLIHLHELRCTILDQFILVDLLDSIYFLIFCERFLKIFRDFLPIEYIRRKLSHIHVIFFLQHRNL